ncbi:transmembrane prolyl 4-hydroxylase-like [Conger conger]|uniref:transmembrane prolyl 4-hydroxylase-like n=1 Tax=Conger conger TaxID=82655 RepID=UPI002A599494|nr:transmembrane prolyl 4-hydroxylase-like [Conger conger]
MMESQELSGTYVSPTLPPLTVPRQDRVLLHKSNVCSRTYFVVVMVFFHVYIINVIALLLYVYYNNGPGEIGTSDGNPVINGESSSHQPPELYKSPDLGSPAKIHLPRFEGIRVGHIQKIALMPNKVHTMQTLSLKPLLFEIPDFLSEEECRVVVQLAQLKGLTESLTTVPEGREEELEQLDLTPEDIFNLLDLNQDGQLQLQEILTHSHTQDGMWLTPERLQEIYAGLKANPDHNGLLSLEEFRGLSTQDLRSFPVQLGAKRPQLVQNRRHTWLYQGEGAHRLLQALRNRVTRLTQLPPSLVDLSEPLQVVRYNQGGHQHAHHDSGPVQPETVCSHTRLAVNVSARYETPCRYITVLFYLNSVESGGETTFPVADNRTYEEKALIQNGVSLLDTQKSCDQGNLRVKPKQGSAIFWYNHLSDGKGWVGELDEYSLHGDCVLAHGTKWVANNWINIDPDYQRQARYQELVAPRQDDDGGGTEANPEEYRDLHQDL